MRVGYRGDVLPALRGVFPVIGFNGPVLRRVWDEVKAAPGITIPAFFDAICYDHGVALTWAMATWMDISLFLDAFSTTEVSLVIH